ncbi:hypothetical protein MHH81_06530 [Psychrobacillus sp. FSL H8-0484]
MIDKTVCEITAVDYPIYTIKILQEMRVPSAPKAPIHRVSSVLSPF